MVLAAMLAYAEAADQSSDLLVLILESLGVLAGVAMAAVAPLFIVTGRRAVRPHFLAPVCLLWAVVAGGGWLYFLFERYHWNAEYQKLVMSGFYDPANVSTRPVLNPVIVLVVAAGYGTLIGAAMWARPLAQKPPAKEGGFPVEPPPHMTNGHPRE